MRNFKVLATCVATFITLCAYSQLSYKINATGQTICYDDKGKVLKSLKVGDKLYGQDANYQRGSAMTFHDNGDGTVSDSNTGLVWQQIPHAEGMTWAEAKEYCEKLELGGHNDWRLPTLKELFSISNFEEGWPYLDTKFFKLSTGRIVKDEQYWADNKYVGETVEGRDDAAFGVNHVTGHIKAYPAGSKMGNREGGGERRPPMPEGEGGGKRPPMQAGNQGRQGGQGSMPPPPGGGGQGGRPMGNPMAKRVRAVRGEAYGVNKFVDNGDGTISDTATGLMWAKDDNGKGVEWVEALPYAEGAELAGYSDWRLPSVKELQSIVDYSRAPSSKGVVAAIDPIFNCTPSVNEAGDADFGYYWTNTSACFTKGRPFYFAWYVAFGRAVNNQGADFHGAGAVRFDSKANNGIAIEGGEERYYNFVRLVRDISKK
ncbi:MAG: DUF1566 domain-containing protein [Rikenellaceae bacterium]